MYLNPCLPAAAVFLAAEMIVVLSSSALCHFSCDVFSPPPLPSSREDLCGQKGSPLLAHSAGLWMLCRRFLRNPIQHFKKVSVVVLRSVHFLSLRWRGNNESVRVCVPLSNDEVIQLPGVRSIVARRACVSILSHCFMKVPERVFSIFTTTCSIRPYQLFEPPGTGTAYASIWYTCFCGAETADGSLPCA